MSPASSWLLLLEVIAGALLLGWALIRYLERSRQADEVEPEWRGPRMSAEEILDRLDDPDVTQLERAALNRVLYELNAAEVLDEIERRAR